MQYLHSRSMRGKLYSTFFVSIGCAALTVMLSSCSPNLPVQHKAQQAEEGVFRTQYSIMCVIHGDGDYLYHDTSGKDCYADAEALAGMKRVGQYNPRAEVFIFHQRPRRHFLFFFPLRDGEFYYYRNGQLIANELYWRNQEQSNFDPEIELYRQFSTDNQRKMASLFLYYGHEIPEFGGAGYNESYPDRPFTVHNFVDGLKEFTHDSTRFDLIVLSTCFGGTPYTIGALGSLARFIIASPDNLHLSYFDLHPLERLDLGLRDRDMAAFAKRFAQQAFDRLASNIQTAVSIAVYDVDRVRRYLNSVDGVYNHTLTTLNGHTLGSVEHCDCAEEPEYLLRGMSEGVDIFYRPPRFGRLKQKQNHSGWECWKDTEPRDTASQTIVPIQK
jgi:hypothetical protein